MHRVRSLVPWLALAAAACGDDATPSADGGRVEDLPVETSLALAGLGDAVDAVQDERGMWHIYAESLDDALRVEGYLMARDRMGQLEFVRRFATGRLAELAGSLRPDLIDSDVGARFEGHARNAAEIYGAMDAEHRELLDAFVEGINFYIERLRADEEAFPRGVEGLLSVGVIGDWTPIDTLAIARFEAAHLSLEGSSDVAMTEALSNWEAAYPEDATDPRVLARRDAFHDLFSFEPPVPTWVRDGFPNSESDSGTRALVDPPRRDAPTPARAISPAVLAGGRRFLQAQERRRAAVLGARTRGSNSWVVHGDKTASGSPLLCNDPHLSLTSPPLFWQVHLNTKRAGGDVDVQGLALVGTPVVLLGYNDHVAWGLTTHFFDVSDVYHEVIVPGVGGAPDKVEFDGGLVELESFTETIHLDTGLTEDVTFEVVPHHGIIIPDSRTDTEALSVRWTGDEPSDEAAAFFGLARATSVDEAREALEHFGVGGQNFVVATRDGDIFWSTQVTLPTRDDRALTYDPETRLGHAPSFVLPGTGEYEWTGTLSDRYLPHALNPSTGFLATANGDAVGVTEDGNPFNDEHYLGWTFSVGYRIGRITERLEELTAGGAVTVDDMQALQADAESQLGRRTASALVAEIGRALEEGATPGTHADLTAAVAALSAAELSEVGEMAERLDAWTTYDTPAAVEGSPTPAEIADSVATSIFNTVFTRLLHLAFMDELERIDYWAVTDGWMLEHKLAGALEWALTDPARLRTYVDDAEDTVLWDDLRTEGVTESRGAQVLAAFVAARAFLRDELGVDMDDWRWGELHTLRLESIVPQLGTDVLSIPTPDDPDFPDGFPRHGDWESVDASSFDLLSRTSFDYGAGPQQRLVVEMTPDGPRPFNAVPGGQALDPDSPHHADEMEHWRHNEAPPVAFHEADVVERAERRWRFEP